jgi:hypothetical protein
MKFIVLFVLLFALCAFAEENTGSILATKIGAADGFVGQDYNVTITVYNNGAAAVTDLVIEDEVPSEEQKTFKVDSLAPGETSTHSYTFKLSETGSLVTEPAKLTYKPKAEEKENKVVKSTNLPVIQVLSSSDYERKHDSHVDEWVIFAVLALIPVGFPFFAYQYSNNQINTLNENAKYK